MFLFSYYAFIVYIVEDFLQLYSCCFDFIFLQFFTHFIFSLLCTLMLDPQRCCVNWIPHIRINKVYPLTYNHILFWKNKSDWLVRGCSRQGKELISWLVQRNIGEVVTWVVCKSACVSVCSNPKKQTHHMYAMFMCSFEDVKIFLTIEYVYKSVQHIFLIFFFFQRTMYYSKHWMCDICL